MQRIAFFGGSFDPPHCGHLAIAKAAADRFSLDKILFAPAGKQPLKAAGADAPFIHRYAMTVLATQTDARFYPSLLDAPVDGHSGDRPNYTVDTLTKLRDSLAASHQPSELFALLGADSWLEIARWHDAQRLLSLADWIVASRPGFSLANAEQVFPPGITAEYGPDQIGDSLTLHHLNRNSTRVHLLRNLQEDVSATELRKSYRVGEPNAMVLPPGVQEYIQKAGLYQH